MAAPRRSPLPGYTFTGISARGGPEKPSGARSHDKVAALMLERIETNDFDILSPGGETTAKQDCRHVA